MMTSPGTPDEQVKTLRGPLAKALNNPELDR